MATLYKKIDIEECNCWLEVVKNLPITRVWRGVEFTLFLEVGKLSKEIYPSRTRGKKISLKGRVTFMLECHWRVERPRSIQFGSHFGDRRINNQLQTLKGVKIDKAFIEGDVPELTICLKDKRRIRTFTNWDNRPRWAVGIKDTKLFEIPSQLKDRDVTPWIGFHSGKLSIAYCYE
jgi:hypothetical protein